jgi:hypothetical protein
VDSGPPVTLSSVTSKRFSAPVGLLEDKAFVGWLVRAGGQDLIKRTMHHMSFSGFCRELQDQGRPLHAGVRMIEMKNIRVLRK